jgi:thiamine-phosphate pyrophosphorylase
VTPLPPLLLLTDRLGCERHGRSLAETVAAAVTGGARAVVLREKDLGLAERAELGRSLSALLEPVGGVLIVASDPALARGLGAGWAHLAEADAAPASASGVRLGRSCHSTAGLLRARDEGAAYATLSPVFATSSKPGYGPTLGLSRLSRLARSVPTLPVYALGGIDSGSAAACRAAGAAGVAVMGAVMGAADPATATRSLLAALDPGATAP